MSNSRVSKIQFDDCLEKYGTDWRRVFSEFERLRKPNTDAIAQMALDNYDEMRDQVADPKFLLKKQIEFALQDRFGERFTPRYIMVTFRRMPYSEAQSRGATQNLVLDRLSAELESIDDLDWELADALMTKYSL